MYSNLKLYFWDSLEDEAISDNDPVEVTLAETIEIMETLPDSDGTFLGLILPDGGTIQFMFTDKHEILMDIPVKEKNGAYNRIIDIQECKEIIRDVFNGKKLLDIEKIAFESWF